MRKIVHIDIDAFYASGEQRDDSQLMNRRAREWAFAGDLREGTLPRP